MDLRAKAKQAESAFKALLTGMRKNLELKAGSEDERIERQTLLRINTSAAYEHSENAKYLRALLYREILGFQRLLDGVQQGVGTDSDISIAEGREALLAVIWLLSHHYKKMDKIVQKALYLADAHEKHGIGEYDPQEYEWDTVTWG